MCVDTGVWLSGRAGLPCSKHDTSRELLLRLAQETLAPSTWSCSQVTDAEYLFHWLDQRWSARSIQYSIHGVLWRGLSWCNARQWIVCHSKILIPAHDTMDRYLTKQICSCKLSAVEYRFSINLTLPRAREDFRTPKIMSWQKNGFQRLSFALSCHINTRGDSSTRPSQSRDTCRSFPCSDSFICRPRWQSPPLI